MKFSNLQPLESAPEPSTHPFTPTRVARYKAAQSSFPRARMSELASFEAAVEAAGRSRPALEIGSGDGMLTRLLLERGYAVDTVDPAFSGLDGVRSHYPEDVSRGLKFLPDDGAYDLIVSLACMHHVVEAGDRLPSVLADDLTRLTRPGGILILQDVGSRKALERTAHQEGATAAGWTVRFFEEVVDRFSEPQHAGVYVELDAVAEQLASLGWETERCFWHACPWSFPDTAALLRFLLTLFNLKMTAERLEGLIAESIVRTEDGARLLWGLHCLVMRRLG